MTEGAPGGEEPSVVVIPQQLTVPIPPPQPTYIVTEQDWARIKRGIAGIRSIESLWLTGMFSCLSIGVSFLTGFLTLQQQDKISTEIQTLFIVVAVAGFSVAFVCLIAYLSGRKSREAMAAVPLDYMREIEAMFPGSQASEQIPSSQSSHSH